MQTPSPRAGLKPVFILLAVLTVTMILTLGGIALQHQGTPSLLANNIVIVILFNVNLILLMVLLLLLSRNLIKLYFERRRKEPGARFQTKLVAAFTGFSIIPTILLVIVASGLLDRSIDNWFNLQTEKSLDRSLDMAQMYYQRIREEALGLGDVLGREAASLPAGSTPGSPAVKALTSRFEAGVREHRLTAAELYGGEGSPLIRIHSGGKSGSFPWINLSERERGKKGARFTFVRPAGEGDAVAAVLPVVRPGETAPWGIVVVYGAIPPEPARKMGEITQSFEEYHQLAALKTPVKRSYLLSFLAIALLILFSATWFGYYLARGITGPVHRLVEATRSVAQGDLGHRIDLHPNDEFGILINAFNKMTEDLQEGSRKLGEANRSLRESNLELEHKRNYVETVLENITTGVISLDHRGGITTINRAAEGILGLTRETLLGKNFQEIFHHVPVEVGRRLVKKIREGQGALEAEQIEFRLRNRIVHLRMNVATLRDEEERHLGTVVAFDDVSELVQAQRAAAWREVAQRLAHEIKNPLTPIQLCTQRLRKKHYEQAPDYDKIFDECTQTIIREVHSLKDLLQEFSTFARMPAPRLAPLALSEVYEEVIRLYRGAHREIEIVGTIDPELPWIQGDREQIKRVLINLFENAVEAMGAKGRLWIRSAHDPENGRVTLEVADEGTGISPEDRSQLFIPYFSRKKTGTGLGLAIVHRIVKDHHGTIRVEDHPPRGTRFIIDFPLGETSVDPSTIES